MRPHASQIYSADVYEVLHSWHAFSMVKSSHFQVQHLIIQIVFSGVFLLTPGKEAYRLKAHEDEDELPILSSPRANTGPVSISLV
jgi:hypothetical protein